MKTGNLNDSKASLSLTHRSVREKGNSKDNPSHPVKVHANLNSSMNEKFKDHVNNKKHGNNKSMSKMTGGLNDSKDMTADMRSTQGSGGKYSTFDRSGRQTSYDMRATNYDTSQIDLPKNINNYRQLYEAHQLHDQDIYWVLNLRQQQNSSSNKNIINMDGEKEEIKKTTIADPPKFFEEDLRKHLNRMKNQDKSLIYEPIKNQNQLFYNHLVNNRKGGGANQAQLSFETTLRNLPDVTLPSGRYSRNYKNTHVNPNKFESVPYNRRSESLYPPYLKPLSDKFIRNVDKIKDKANIKHHELNKDTKEDINIIVRPLKYSLSVIIIITYTYNIHIYLLLSSLTLITII